MISPSQARGHAAADTPSQSVVGAKASVDEQDDETYLCPILRETMTEPVVAADGITYERSAIQKWFEVRTPATSPATGLVLPNTELRPNLLARGLIEKHFAARGVRRSLPSPIFAFDGRGAASPRTAQVAALRALAVLVTLGGFIAGAAVAIVGAIAGARAGDPDAVILMVGAGFMIFFGGVMLGGKLEDYAMSLQRRSPAG